MTELVSDESKVKGRSAEVLLEHKLDLLSRELGPRSALRMRTAITEARDAERLGTLECLTESTLELMLQDMRKTRRTFPTKRKLMTLIARARRDRE